MSLTNKIANIKNQLKQILLADATLKLDDNSIVSTNSIDPAVGVAIFTMNADGTLTPMVDGDYTFEDGTQFTVANGLIASYGSFLPADTADMADVAPAPTDAVDPDAAEDTAETQALTDLTARVASLEDTVNQVMELLQELTTTSQDMSKKINKIGKQPAVDPIKENKKEAMANNNVSESFLKSRKNKKILMPSGNVTITSK